MIENEEYFHTYEVDYHGGEQYPHLEKAGGADMLSEIAKRKAEEVK